MTVPYILRRTDQGGGFLMPPGSPGTYSFNPLRARRFPTREDAQREACENETPVDLLEV